MPTNASAQRFTSSMTACRSAVGLLPSSLRFGSSYMPSSESASRPGGLTVCLVDFNGSDGGVSARCDEDRLGTLSCESESKSKGLPSPELVQLRSRMTPVLAPIGSCGCAGVRAGEQRRVGEQMRVGEQPREFPLQAAPGTAPRDPGATSCTNCCCKSIRNTCGRLLRRSQC